MTTQENTPPASDEPQERTLEEVIEGMQADNEGRLTFRLLRHDLLLMGKFCKGLEVPASLQELLERALNEWFWQRGIAVRLNVSTKQSRDPDPFAQWPVIRQLPIGTKPPPRAAAVQPSASDASGASTDQPAKRPRGRPRKNPL